MEQKKLLSIAVPCYNSAAYMENCVNSLLPGGEDVEILIVDDGSQKDNTLEIAQRLEAEHPGIVRAIHQENAGHGGAVNTGIRNATGLYFKVVDSDDHLDPEAYAEALSYLKQAAASGEMPDMVLTNFVYDKQGATHKKVMDYHKYFPTGKIFRWREVKPLPFTTYILMHSIMYRLEVLKKSNTVLPEKTFYVDNLYATMPLPYVHTIYYLDVNLYMYFIGREDQSVNEKVMIGRLDQQFRVTRIMIDRTIEAENSNIIANEVIHTNLLNYLNIMMTISSILAVKSGTPEHLAMKKELWAYLKEKSPEIWAHFCRHTTLGILCSMPESFRPLQIFIYNMANKIYGFN